MYLRTLALASVFAAAAFAQPATIVNTGEIDSFQVSYASNINIGDSFVNLTNTGEYVTGSGFTFTGGTLCANFYVFDPAEEMIACCSCPVTPNGLDEVSVRNDLLFSTLTGGSTSAVVIKLIASAGLPLCSPTAPTATTLVSGLRAWSTTIHAEPVAGTYGITEVPFLPSGLSAGELAKDVSFCGFIIADASGAGICNSCKVGGLGASKM